MLLKISKKLIETVEVLSVTHSALNPLSKQPPSNNTCLTGGGALTKASARMFRLVAVSVIDS